MVDVLWWHGHGAAGRSVREGVGGGGGVVVVFFFFSSRRRHTRLVSDWSSDVCSSDLVRGLFAEFCEGMPEDLTFAIDELAGDDRAVGVMWHLELGGIAFPNSRGASFYRISEGSGKLCFARDVVEPPFKPGKAVLPIIKLVIPLVRRFLK